MARYKDVRLDDVARAAGVSPSTVSHVLNGTRYVSPEVRARVEQAISALGYARAPNRGARRVRAIGLAATAASNPYTADLILGVESECKRAGFSMLLCDTHDDPDEECDAVASLLNHRIDGLVLAPTANWEKSTLPLIRRDATPFVLIDRFCDVPCDQVGVESETTSFTLVNHLIQHGHERIGMVRGLAGLSTTAGRLRGYRRALEQAGLPYDESLVEAGQSTVMHGRQATLRLLEKGPTALFTANNAMTIGTLLALADAGVAVPDDIALVAYDDVEWAEAMQSSITSAAQPFHAVGARAVQLLVQRMANPVMAPQTVRLPPSVEHRTSCGCVSPDPEDNAPRVAAPATSRTPIRLV